MNTSDVGLHWRESGEGRPMVFLHGLADCHLSLMPLAESFPQRRRLVLDLPGHGLSERPIASYTPEWYHGVIGSWWDRLGLSDVDLVAHSYGGAIAQLLALSHREQVRSLTLIAPGGLGPEVGVGLKLLSLPYAAEVMAPFLGPGLRWVLRDLGAPAEVAAYGGWLGARPGTARAVTLTARAAIDFTGQTRGAHERIEELGSMAPTALLWGTADPIIPVLQAHRAKRWLPAMDLRLYAGAKHWPHVEQKASVVHDLRELLERHDRARVKVAFEHLPPRRPPFVKRAYFFLRSLPGRVRAWWRRLWQPRTLRLSPCAGGSGGATT